MKGGEKPHEKRKEGNVSRESPLFSQGGVRKGDMNEM